MCFEAYQGVFVEKSEKFFLCLVLPAPRSGLFKAPHTSGVHWKQFMALLEEGLISGGVSLHSPSLHARVGEG